MDIFDFILIFPVAEAAETFYPSGAADFAPGGALKPSSPAQDWPLTAFPPPSWTLGMP